MGGHAFILKLKGACLMQDSFGASAFLFLPIVGENQRF
jgi:hypothetical protein